MKNQIVAKPANVPTLRVLQGDIADVTSILQENAGAVGFSDLDLERIKIPAGGGVAWEVNSLSGVESVKELEGVIVAFRDIRTFWRKSFEESGGAPPDCSSIDSVTGVGDPGGLCAMCPLAQFGSDGRRQACRQGRQLFLLRGDAILPDVVNLAPTSLAAARKFFLRLTSQGIPFYGAIVKIGLEKDKNSDGIAYAKATFTLARVLTEEETARTRTYASMFKPMVQRLAVHVEGDARAI